MTTMRPHRLGKQLFASSIFLNIVVGLWISGLPHLAAEPPLQSIAEDECAKVGPQFTPWEQGSFIFCQARDDSRLAEILPNEVYIVRDGITWLTLRLSSDDKQSIREISVADKLGRPWMTVSYEDRSLIYNRYKDDVQKDPYMSLLEKTGDGVPDTMINWELKQGYQRDGDVTWHLLKKQDHDQDTEQDTERRR